MDFHKTFFGNCDDEWLQDSWGQIQKFLWLIEQKVLFIETSSDDAKIHYLKISSYYARKISFPSNSKTFRVFAFIMLRTTQSQQQQLQCELDVMLTVKEIRQRDIRVLRDREKEILSLSCMTLKKFLSNNIEARIFARYCDTEITSHWGVNITSDFIPHCMATAINPLWPLIISVS